VSSDFPPSFASRGEKQFSKRHGSTRRSVVFLLEVLLLVVLGGVVYSKWDRIREIFHPKNELIDAGNDVEPAGDKAAEKEAYETLTKRGFWLLAEPESAGSPDKRVSYMTFARKKIDEDSLALVPKLYRLGVADANGSTITNDQLKYFAGLSMLNSLTLNKTAITDEGLAQLRPLAPNLETLALSDTRISDRGLDEIAYLHNIKVLNLKNTKVTDEGMKKLLPLTNLKWLVLIDTGITDAGLKQLAEIKSLSQLEVVGTKVTWPGVRWLQKAHPGLKVDKVRAGK
jgi:Leucine-rich repeat (LRR) protein